MLRSGLWDNSVSAVMTAFSNPAASSNSAASFLEALSEESNQIVFAFSITAHQFTYLNPAFEKVWRTTRKSILDNPASLLKTIHPADRVHVQQNYQELLEGIIIQEIEFRIVLQNSTERWVSVTPQLLREQSLITGYARDITAQKQNEEALQESEAQIAADLAGMRRLYELQAKLAVQTDVEAAFQEVLALACEFTNTDRGCVQFLSSDGARLEMFVWQGYPDDSPFISFFRYEGLEQGCEVTRVERQRLIIEETIGFEGLAGTDAGAATYADGIRAAQSTPMTSRSNETIGVISTQFRQPHRPSDYELRLMDMLAWTAAEYLERHRANMALRHSEERYRTLFETMDEAYYVIEMLFDADNKPVDYRFLESNPAFEKLTGLQNAAGKTVRELVPEIEEFWIEKYGEVALTGEPTRYSNRVAGLQDRWYDGFAFRLGGEESRLVAIVFSEITERKRAEEALRESEEKYRSLFNSIDEGFCTVQVLFDEQEQAVDYCFLDTNPAFEAQTGLASATGRTMLELQPNHESFWFETYGKVALTGESIRFEAYGAALNRWFTVYALRVGEPENRQVAIVFSDISKSKRAEKALRESEARLQKAMAIETVSLIFFDGEGYLTGCNDAFLQMSGFSREQIESGEINWEDLTPPEWIARSQKAFAELQQKGRTTPYEKEYFRPDGSRYWGLFAASNIDENESVEYIIDISERKRTEETLRTAEAQYLIQLEQEVTQRTAELQESTELLQSVFDTTLMGVSVLKAVRDESGAIEDFKIQLANKELQRETNRTDLEGKYYAQEFPGIKQAGMFQLMLQVVESGESAGREFYYPYDGLNKWYSSMFVKLDDGVVATNLDITSRKLAEQELIKNLTLLQQAEQVSRMGSWEYDMATKDFTWSEGMYSLFNLPMGKPVRPEIYLDYALPADLPIAEKIVQDIKVPRQAFAETLRILVDGQEVTLKIKAIVQENLLGGSKKVLGVDVDVSEIKQLEENNLQMRLEQQKALLVAILDAQEEERRRISESLHNGVGQLLYAIQLNLHQVAKLVQPSIIQSAEKLLGEAIEETRRVSHELVPFILNDFGLAQAFQHLCSNYDKSTIRVNCEVEGLEHRLESYFEVAIYRICQELLNNVVKHALATKVDILLVQEDGEITLKVRDNGIGISQPLGQKKGIGLRTISDRVKLLNGTFSITNLNSSKGTLVIIRIPL